MSFGINTPQEDHDMEWATAVDELQRENEMLHAENALKLTQILDLESLIYKLREGNMQDDSPCYCSMHVFELAFDSEAVPHSDNCEKARKATEHLWKSPTS